MSEVEIIIKREIVAYNDLYFRKTYKNDFQFRLELVGHILILLETIPLLTHFVCDVAIVMFTVGVMGLK